MNRLPFDKEPKVTRWRERLEKSGCRINGLHSEHELHRPNGELLFALAHADVTAPDGNNLPSCIFLRGDACIVVPLIRNNDTGEKRFLMVLQRRIAHGAPSLEFPAGMLDRNTDNPALVAVRELREETGLSISVDALFPLSAVPLYSSAGACDEAIHYFGCTVDLDAAVFASLEGRIAGADADEHIGVTLRTREQARAEANSLGAQLGVFLFEEYLRAHRKDSSTP